MTHVFAVLRHYHNGGSHPLLNGRSVEGPFDLLRSGDPIWGDIISIAGDRETAERFMEVEIHDRQETSEWDRGHWAVRAMER